MAKDHVKFFLEKYKNISKDEYNHIYWQGLDQAHNKLTDTENINLTKYLNGWLNTGRHKDIFGEVSECPYCGWHEETQLHRFQYTSPEIKRTRKVSFQLLKKYYHQYKIPAVVYIPFLKMSRATCKLKELKWPDPPSLIIRQAIRNQ